MSFIIFSGNIVFKAYIDAHRVGSHICCSCGQALEVLEQKWTPFYEDNKHPVHLEGCHNFGK